MTDAPQALLDKLMAAAALVEEARQELFVPTPAPKPAEPAAPTYQFNTQNLTIHVSSTARLENIMTDINASIQTLTATLDATSATLDKVTDEYITTVADLTDKLADALAAGQITPALIAAVKAAEDKATALKGKADALDALKPDAA